MQLVRAAVDGVAEFVKVICRQRTLLHHQGRFKATAIGTGVWAAATAASTTVIGAGGLSFKGLACERPGEMFPALYDSAVGWDLWFNTPWSFTVAVVCITVSMGWAHCVGLGTVKAVAYCSLPLQAWWWHGLLLLNECA